MGLRSFSMSPAFIPTIKELLNHLSVAKAEEILRRVERLKTTAEVNRAMKQHLAQIAPNLKLLDTA
jgi:phosphotransferase system enzyme I (PtsI)